MVVTFGSFSELLRVIRHHAPNWYTVAGASPQVVRRILIGVVDVAIRFNPDAKATVRELPTRRVAAFTLRSDVVHVISFYRNRNGVPGYERGGPDGEKTNK